jgi:hypothetical protein
VRFPPTRLSEKTLELNFCSQATRAYPSNVVWFGLTQRQEALWGFDAAMEMGGRLLIFQFKASTRVLQSGARQFQAPHEQMENLRRRPGSAMRSVFYVFPMLGELAEFRAVRGDVLGNSWLLDVTDIPPLGRPRRRDGALRRAGAHYVDVDPPQATIHSDPVDPPVLNARQFFQDGAGGADGLYEDVVGAFRRMKFRNAAGAILLPR